MLARQSPAIAVIDDELLVYGGEARSDLVGEPCIVDLGDGKVRCQHGGMLLAWRLGLQHLCMLATSAWVLEAFLLLLCCSKFMTGSCRQ